jgi:iron complex outermembrane receptor protein
MWQRSFLVGASVLSLTIGTTSPVWAQQTETDSSTSVMETATGDAPVANNDIVVTGTRITRDGFSAPTPVSVITAEQIEAAAQPNIADYVNQLPALFGSNSPRTTNTIIGGGLAGANILNLRNLGTTRTLTLFNGRRMTPSFLNGAVDINSIPSALIERVDIVTGGASAAWGSDAVSGVANFVLNTKFTGIKGEVQGGATTHGDGENWSGELSYGTAFAGGRGHFIVSGNYSQTKPAYAGDRDWFQGYKILTNPAFAPGNGQPARLILPNSSLYVNGPGFIASGPLRGTQFDANGQVLPTPFNFGGVIASGTLASGAATEDVSEVFELQLPLWQANGYSRISYDLTDDINIFGEASYGKSRAKVQASWFFRPGNATVAFDNAYLPASVSAQMIAAGVTSFPLNASYARFGRPRGINTRELQRYLGGFNANLGSGWSVDGYAQYGVATIQTKAINNLMPGRYALAADSVFNSGQIVCRSSIANPGNGCVPLNPLGTAPLTDAQRGYLIGTAVQNQKIRETVAALTVHGDLFELPAGSVSTAFGVEYRRESATADADAVSIASQYYVGNYKPFRGRFSVKEAFAEIVIPVLKDSAIGTLDLNTAGRITDYTTSGTVGTWKVGATWKPTSDLTIRATRSRDIRAPNLNDLFLGGQTNINNITDPGRNNQNAVISVVTSGNTALKPEIASTLTAGVVLQPSWLSGFSASVDFYRIKIDDAIFTPSATQILNQCIAGDQLACALTTRDANGILTQVRSIPINQRSEIAQGIDFEASYRTEVGNLFSSEPGHLEFRAMVNYTDKLDIIGAVDRVRRAGEVGTNLGAAQGVPRYRALASVGYNADPVNLQFKARFLSASKIEADWGPLDVNRNKVPAIVYLDMFAGYDLKIGDGKTQIYFAVDNLLDRDPPVAVSQDNINAVGTGTNVIVYDAIGRTWRVGMRFSF